MGRFKAGGCRLHEESGAVLLIVAAAMVAMLGVAALSIDLVSLYVARSESQSAADAAALAGASAFVSQGCAADSAGCVAGGPQESVARAEAVTLAAQNLVAGSAPSSSTVATSFTYPTPEEPQITVTVYRDAAHGNAMPTFFARIFGISTVNVSATATAEAFDPSRGTVPIAVQWSRPFLVPNCDPAHPVPAGDPEANTNCGSVSAPAGGPPGQKKKNTYYASYFFDPNNHYAIVNPGLYNASNPSAGGIIGEPWQLSSNAAPSQWYRFGYTGSDNSTLTSYLQTSAAAVVSCGSAVNTAGVSATASMAQAAEQGVNALIKADGDGLNRGQDAICSPATSAACSSPPFPITGGSNNPNRSLIGKVYYGPSSSIADVAVYDGHALNSGSDTATVVGFMNVFIQDAALSSKTVSMDTVILTVGGCGASRTAGPPVTAQGSAVPIRLVRR